MIRAITELCSVLVFAFLSGVLPVIDGNTASSQQGDSQSPRPFDQCIDTFESFAYEAHLRPLSLEARHVPIPLEPVASLPSEAMSGYDLRVLQINFIRDTPNGQEMWFSGAAQPTSIDLPRTSYIAIYFTDEQRWEIHSGSIQGTTAFVRDPFMTPDGSIWGVSGWDGRYEFTPNLQRLPVLARFDETSDSFVFTDGAPFRAPFPTNLQPYWFNSPRAVVDQSGIIWIFNSDNGIYRYDPLTDSNSLEGLIPIFPAGAAYVTLAPDNTIYIGSATGQNPRTLQNNPIFRFVEGDSAFTMIDLPAEEWANYNGMLFDAADNLWVGDVGYRTPAEEWTLVDPSPIDFSLVDPVIPSGNDRLPTEIAYATLDGRVWFRRFVDSNRLAGTAWYDPITNQGCQFTTTPILSFHEDEQQRLWFTTSAGDVYVYELTP